MNFSTLSLSLSLFPKKINSEIGPSVLFIFIFTRLHKIQPITCVTALFPFSLRYHSLPPAHPLCARNQREIYRHFFFCKNRQTISPQGQFFFQKSIPPLVYFFSSSFHFLKTFFSFITLVGFFSSDFNRKLTITVYNSSSIHISGPFFKRGFLTKTGHSEKKNGFVVYIVWTAIKPL